MKTFAVFAVCAAMAMPLFAHAQSAADVAYCNKLSEAYRGTVAKTATPDAVVPTAMSKCASTPASSIPVLEKALTDGKVTLPKRD